MIVTFSYFFAWNLGSNDEETETATDDGSYEPFETDEQLSAENQAPSGVNYNYTHYLCKTENCSKSYTNVEILVHPHISKKYILLKYINLIGDWIEKMGCQAFFWLCSGFLLSFCSLLLQFLFHLFIVQKGIQDKNSVA